MYTSRSQLERLLDPENISLNLKTLTNAAEAMGKHIEIRIVKNKVNQPRLRIRSVFCQSGLQ